MISSGLTGGGGEGRGTDMCDFQAKVMFPLSSCSIVLSPSPLLFLFYLQLQKSWRPSISHCIQNGEEPPEPYKILSRKIPTSCQVKETLSVASGIINYTKPFPSFALKYCDKALFSKPTLSHVSQKEPPSPAHFLAYFLFTLSYSLYFPLSFIFYHHYN